MDIVALVIAQGSPLRDALQLLGGDGFDLVLHTGGQVSYLEGVDGFANIAAAGHRNAVQDAVVDLQGKPVLLGFPRQNRDAAVQGSFDFLRRDSLEFKDGASADDRIVDIKIGVFGRGGNQRDLTVFQKFQKGLLLLFI